ncbi:hypothetical protein F4778DRAFT_780250 [Xylariomycetidae sp. FL2044]|nr:hypothetical protein F4778DRAFT_780250 [Xylariomycetidae sp. FL2044]
MPRIYWIRETIDGEKRYICLVCEMKPGKRSYPNLTNNAHCIRSHLCKFHPDDKNYLVYLAGVNRMKAHLASVFIELPECHATMDAVIAGGRPITCPDCGKQYRGPSAAKS